MKVSVIVPSHNAGRYLRQTLGSLLDQTERPDEIIVVDDGSQDDSLDIARSFEAQRGSRLRVVAENFGHACRARNLGAELAQGDALMFLDADDVLAPDALAALAAALAGVSGGVSVCPWQRLELADERWLNRPASCAPRYPDQDALSAWLTGWYHPPCSVLWSRDGLARAGGWDESVALNQDGDVMMRALVEGVPLAETNAGLAFYRRAPKGETSLSGKRETEVGIEGRLQVLEKIAERLEIQGRIDAYRASASRAFALIADDAHAWPHLRERALRHAHRLRPPHWQELRTRLRRHGARPALPTAREPSYGKEIRFGLHPRMETQPTMQRKEQGCAKPAERVDARPSVSVVIPTYDRPELLSRAIESVLGQSFGDFELLVVDDGPSEATAAVVLQFDDRRLRYLPQPRNRGVAAARNRGMWEARGEFVAFLDDDDEWLPEKLALQVELMRRSGPEVGLIYTGVESVLADGRRQEKTAEVRGDISRAMLLRNVIHGGGSNVLMRRRLIADVGYFDERLPAIEDYDYWLRISRRYRVDCVPLPLVRYYDDRLASAARRSANQTANLAARSMFYRKYQRQMQEAGSAHLFLLDTARRALLPPNVDRRSARSAAVQAIVAAPVRLAGYRTLVRLLLPAGRSGP